MNVNNIKNNIFLNNLNSLKVHYPELYEKILNYNAQEDKFSLIQMPNGYYNIVDKEVTFVYYDVDNTLAKIKENFKTLSLKNAGIALFLGIGLGYEAIYYFTHISQDVGTKYAVIIEKELEIFIKALQVTDLTQIISNGVFKLVVGETEDDLYYLFRDLMKKNNIWIWYIKAAKPVYYDSSLRLNGEYFKKAVKAFAESSRDVLVDYGNDPHDSIIGLQNILENINVILENPGINLLYDKFKNKPAVVVSTGPSLNKNKHLLKGLEDKAVIICADSCLNILVDMGVRPHFVTALERVEEIIKFFEGYSEEEVSDTYMAACPVVMNEAYRAYKGPKAIVYRNYDHFKWLDIDRGMLEIKDSAGNMSFKIAEALGCNPIMLIGQDLAMSPEKKTHADGNIYGTENEFYFQENKLEVPANNGGTITTTPTLYRFLKGYEIDVWGYKGTCINCTEGGAYISGTEVMSFQNAIDKYIRTPFDPLNIIRDQFSYFDKATIDKDRKRIKQLFNQTIDDLKAIVGYCNTGLDFYKKNEVRYINMKNKRSFSDKQKEMIDADGEKLTALKTKAVQERMKTVQLFFAHIIQPFFLKFEVEFNGVPDKFDSLEAINIEAILMHKEWFETYGTIANKCIDILEEALLKQENE